MLEEIARGEVGLIDLFQHFDGEGQPILLSTIAVAGVATSIGSSDAHDLLAGLARMTSVTLSSIADVEEAFAVGEVIRRTGLDTFDAHVAALADTYICPILTLDQAKWDEPATALDEPLHIIEISDTP